MGENKWKYVTELHDQKAVEKFLNQYNVILPEQLIDFLIKNNAGTPSDDVFDTNISKGYCFKCLLSYNKEDYDNVYDYYPDLFKNSTLFPIGMDCSGNFVCYDQANKKYVLINHETNEIEYIVSEE